MATRVSESRACVYTVYFVVWRRRLNRIARERSRHRGSFVIPWIKSCPLDYGKERNSPHGFSLQGRRQKSANPKTRETAVRPGSRSCSRSWPESWPSFPIGRRRSRIQPAGPSLRRSRGRIYQGGSPSTPPPRGTPCNDGGAILCHHHAMLLTTASRSRIFVALHLVPWRLFVCRPTRRDSDDPELNEHSSPSRYVCIFATIANFLSQATSTYPFAYALCD